MNSGDHNSNAEISRQDRSPATAGARTIRIADNRIDSRDLFASTREIMIAHAGDVYRLRLTAQNKLILTK